MKKEQKKDLWYGASSSDLIRADATTAKIIEAHSKNGLRWLCALCYLAGEAQAKKNGKEVSK